MGIVKFLPIFLMFCLLAGPALGQDLGGRSCVVLLSAKKGDQRPLLDEVKALRTRMGVDKGDLPVAEFYWENEGHRKVIVEVLGLHDYQLPLATTGVINAAMLPTSANRHRPSLELPRLVIAHYLFNEWARRAQRDYALWNYAEPGAPEGAQLPATEQNAKDGSQLLLVKGGEFWMGSTEGEIDELPPRIEKLKPFYIGRTEVSVAQFRRFVEATGYRTRAEEHGFGFVWAGEWKRTRGASWRNPDGKGPPASPDHPVRQLSGDDCRAYCDWAGLRLPTESEWERAARGRRGRQYPWGERWDPRKAVYQVEGPSKVGSKPAGASPCGALDMAGNVREWTSTSYAPYLPNPEEPPNQARLAVRGGAWNESKPGELRGAYRFNGMAGLPNNRTGFRVARGTRSGIGGSFNGGNESLTSCENSGPLSYFFR